MTQHNGKNRNAKRSAVTGWLGVALLAVALVPTGVASRAWADGASQHDNPAAKSEHKEEGHGEGHGEGHEAEHHEGEGLEGHMEQMGRALRQVKTALKDPAKKEDALKALTKLQNATLEAKTELPPKIAKLAEGEREKAAGEYRSMIRNLLRAQLDLEDAIVAGDSAKITEGLATIEEIEKAGHSEYRGKKKSGEKKPTASAGSATTRPAN